MFATFGPSTTVQVKAPAAGSKFTAVFPGKVGARPFPNFTANVWPASTSNFNVTPALCSSQTVIPAGSLPARTQVG